MGGKMPSRVIEDLLNQISSGDDSNRFEKIRYFLDRVHENYESASKKMIKNWVYILIGWTLVYLIGKGIVGDGQIASFRILEVKSILIGAPILLGITAYSFFTSMSGAYIFWQAIHSGYKHYMPKISEGQLGGIMTSPTLFDVELLLDILTGSKNKGIKKFVDSIPIAVIFLCPFIAIIHVHIILDSLHIWSRWITIPVAMTGYFMYYKGISNLVKLAKAFTQETVERK
jgi:hypothetical protein